MLKTPEMLVRVRKAINEEPRALARYVRVVMAAAKESGQSTEYGKLAAFAVATLHTQSPGVVTVNGEEWPLRVRASYEAVAASLVELGYAEAEVPSKAAVVGHYNKFGSSVKGTMKVFRCSKGDGAPSGSAAAADSAEEDAALEGSPARGGRTPGATAGPASGRTPGAAAGPAAGPRALALAAPKATAPPDELLRFWREAVREMRGEGVMPLYLRTDFGVDEAGEEEEVAMLGVTKDGQRYELVQGARDFEAAYGDLVLLRAEQQACKAAKSAAAREVASAEAAAARAQAALAKVSAAALPRFLVSDHCCADEG